MEDVRTAKERISKENKENSDTHKQICSGFFCDDNGFP